ncbi:hypothetical protein ACHAW5_007779 [Stephanodiscus triporus]|uniref:Uncharacterized protein n=1 Tax=Stephanodiscus triporus TaxID=2934178 RepID=A0ABD3NKC2_9STRA
MIALSPYASFLFEFALIDAPKLGRFAEGGPDRDAFAEHFGDPPPLSLSSSSLSCGGGVCWFENLGCDATLVLPVPLDHVDDATYSHLARFVREASTYLDVLKRKDEDNGGDNKAKM